MAIIPLGGYFKRYDRMACHNDFYKGVSNASTAWLYGASFKGSFDGMDPTVITEIANYISKETNYDIPPMTPFVGENFNLTKAGIHADGLLKDEEIYNIFDTKKLLNRPPLVAINNISGVAGIAYWLNQYYNNTEETMISKKDPLVLYIKKWVDEQYEGGRITYITTAELVSLVEQYHSQNNISH